MKEILLIIGVILLALIAVNIETVNGLFIIYYVILYFTLKIGYSIFKD